MSRRFAALFLALVGLLVILAVYVGGTVFLLLHTFLGTLEIIGGGSNG